MLILDLPLLSYFSYVILTLTILTMHLTLIFTYELVTDKFFFPFFIFICSFNLLTVFVILNHYFVNIYTIPCKFI
jgi:hypothetical protein